MTNVTPVAMLFPNYVNGVAVDESMNFTPDWNIYFSQLTQNLQVNFSEEGISLPSNTTVTIANLLANDTQGLLNNKMFVDSDLGLVQIFMNGVLRTFTVV